MKLQSLDDFFRLEFAIAHRIELRFDAPTGTFELTDAMREFADRLAEDGTLACLSEARDFHARDDARSVNEAHRLLLLVHLRGLELKSPAMSREAANVCRSARGCPTHVVVLS